MSILVTLMALRCISEWLLRVADKAEVDLLLMNIEKNRELGSDTGYRSFQSRRDPAYVENRQRALNTMETYDTLNVLAVAAYLILFFLPTILMPGGALYFIYACPLLLLVESLLDVFISWALRPAGLRAVQEYLDGCSDYVRRRDGWILLTDHSRIVAMLHAHRGDGYFGRPRNVVRGY